MILKKLTKTFFFTELIAIIAAIYLWLVKLTSIIKIEHKINLINAEKSAKPIIFAIWHGRIFYSVMVCSSLYKYQNYSLVSKHSDGQIIASFVKKFNSKVIEGSSSAGGFKAFKEILKKIKTAKQRLCITPDGPRGPNMKINSAIIEIASRTNAVIVPLSYSAKYAKFMNSWDKMLIPRIFNHITIAYGEAIIVDKKIKPTERKKYEAKLELILKNLTNQLDKKYNHAKIQTGSQNYKRI